MLGQRNLSNRQLLGRIEARGAMKMESWWVQIETKDWSRWLSVLMQLWQARAKKRHPSILQNGEPFV